MRRIYAVLGVILLLLAVLLAAFGLVVSHNSPCGTAPALAAGTPAMKAIVYRCYGPASVLRLEEVAKPGVPDGGVLVRVHAASINPYEWHFMRGSPYIMRLGAGLGSPKDVRLGSDFAGTVEAVGQKVTRFKLGDEVFGVADGALAEYVTVREGGAISPKPAALSFDQAAAVPIAAITALQAVRDKGHVGAGNKILINGASGGVGTFAVQIAKSSGAEVTGVCSTRNLDLVRSLGADHVIDYTREDFTQGGIQYDVIIDTVGNHPLLQYRRLLTRQGILVILGGPRGDWIGPLGPLIKALLVGPFVSQSFVPLFAQLKQQDLDTLGALMQAGKVTPVIDRRYPLDELAAAMTYLEAGHARGKVVIDLP
jgi:NADPH:quinone reductase-like Zn-dependent oxidoreductase